MPLAETATLLTAIFAAVAAGAAWATVGTDWLRQRKARHPNVSAGFLDMGERQAIEFVNMGPGLAIQLGYAILANNIRDGGMVGTGHLQAGESQRVRVQVRVTGRTADFVWACRDIDQRLHVWSYSGKHRRLRKGQYPNMGECFRMMYPTAFFPPRNVGMNEDLTAPGD